MITVVPAGIVTVAACDVPSDQSVAPLADTPASSSHVAAPPLPLEAPAPLLLLPAAAPPELPDPPLLDPPPGPTLAGLDAEQPADSATATGAISIQPTPMALIAFPLSMAHDNRIAGRAHSQSSVRHACAPPRHARPRCKFTARPAAPFRAIRPPS